MQENERTSTADSIQADDDWLDEVLRESFPASDPAPWRHRDLTDEASGERSVAPGRHSSERLPKHS